MPAAMHSFYLRNFYVHNKLAKGELEIAGRLIDLRSIRGNAYYVGAENDHIVPWRSGYAGARLLGAQTRFVLSSGGHIAGIVNPPSPKSWYVVGDGLPDEADAWRQQGERVQGSWWQDWADWSAEHGGELVDPPPMGSAAHPARYDGPGEYVHE
jgi:polyhydroxyalkanoate synthase